jgi:hypothetical protein
MYMPDINVNKVFVIIPKLLVNLLYFLVRISISMLEPVYQTWDMKMPRTCVAFVDSVIDCRGWDCSLQSNGNFLYSAVTANSTMDNLTKKMEDGIVNSLPNYNAQPMTVSSLSPLRAKLTTPVQISGLIR